jgi:hypothetical protein
MGLAIVDLRLPIGQWKNWATDTPLSDWMSGWIVSDDSNVLD